MSRKLAQACKRVARDQRGNVAVLFAFSAVPVIGLLGGAVDITRHHRHEVSLLNAMDAAAIALVRQGEKSDADADAFVNSYINTMAPQGDTMLHMQPFDAVKISGGYRVVGEGSMDTAFMPVVGIEQLPLDLTTEVMSTSGKFEIALALDNTGSMRNYGRIEALRDSAAQLVEDLYREDGTEDRVKMALVPFVTAVNIKSADVFNPSWIDPVGSQAYYHRNFSQPVNRLELFDKMHVEWAGCVEARAEHDEDDASPDSAATRWVPYLWPDEPDRGFSNSYLRDSSTRSDRDRLRDIAKYNVAAGARVTNTSVLGPNAACPRPIVPLTNDTDLMTQEIRLMKPHNEYGANNSGTNVAQGLAWAWRVLSPEAPFEEGVSYSDDETTKVVVLLSDGRNQIVPNGEITESDYTSFGYLADNRLGSSDNYLVAERNVDQKVARVCANMKKEGIRVYTILFQVDYQQTQDLFRNCASKDDEGKPLYYYVPAASDLETAFRDIGEDLTTLRITR